MLLSEILSDIRLILDDVVVPYLWSDDELIKYISNTIDEVCEECFVLEEDEPTLIIIGGADISFNAADRTITKLSGGFLTAGFYNKSTVTITNTVSNNVAMYITRVSDTILTTSSQVTNEINTNARIEATATIFRIPVINAQHTYVIDDRLVRIQTARLDSQTKELEVTDVGYMDNYFYGWKKAKADKPVNLISDGVGVNKLRLYPPPDAADILRLTGYRLPYKTPLTSADTETALEIPLKVQKKLYNGILEKAYRKQDSETEAQARANSHKILYKEDKDLILKYTARFDRRARVVSPLRGNL